MPDSVAKRTEILQKLGWSIGLNGTHTKSELEKFENDGLFEHLFQFKTHLESII